MVISNRLFLLLSGIFLPLKLIMGEFCDSRPASNLYADLRFPAEWEPHKLTIMSYPSAYYIWGRQLVKVQKDIAKIAKAVSKFEKVVIMAQKSEISDAKSHFTHRELENITFVPIRPDDLWARDTVPIFLVNNESQLVGVDLRFNGWGNKQEHYYDSQIAGKVVSHYNIDCVSSPIVAEAGSFETDGQGTLLVTESSVINKNRNPGKNKEFVDKELKETLGVSKIIWLQGVKGLDITDAHVDCLARFASPGVVVLNTPAPDTPESEAWAVVSRKAKEILQNATDAKGNPLTIVELPEPDPYKISYQGTEEIVTSYVNYLVVNGGVIIPKFGDKEADDNAKKTIQDLYPDREVVQIQIDTVASGGGGIHCATHDMPLL